MKWNPGLAISGISLFLFQEFFIDFSCQQPCLFARSVLQVATTAACLLTFVFIDRFIFSTFVSSVVVSNRESACVRVDTNDRLTARISTEHCPSYSAHDQVNVNMSLSFHTVVWNVLFSCRGPLASNPQCKDAMDTFLSLAVRPITTLFQITGYNRARQRDKYGHLLEELAALQEEVNYKIWYSFARHQGCTFFLKTLF